MMAKNHQPKLVTCLQTLSFCLKHTYQVAGYMILIFFCHHKIDIITLRIEIYCRCNIGHLYLINL